MALKRAIAGVTTGKKQRGEIIELEPEKKAALAVKEGLSKQDVWPGSLAHGTEIKVDELTFSSKGNLFKKKYLHNVYKARGVVTVHVRDAAKDIQRAPRRMKFKINFCDCLDRQGVPDLTVDTFELTPA